MRILQRSTLTILEIKASTTQSSSTSSTAAIPFGPFNSTTQRRWKKKPTETARTRLEGRTRDLKLDKLTTLHNRFALVLGLRRLMSARKRGPFVSVQTMSRWNNLVGLNIAVGDFLRKYPHIFEVFTHPVRRNVCCKLTLKMRALIEEEEDVIRASESENVRRIKKLLMMSVNGSLHIHALRLVRRELGLPEDFRESILAKYVNEFRLIDLEVVAMVGRDEDLGLAKVEKWRKREFTEKWLSEFETKYAFPINFPTGFKIEAGFREKLKNWQRLPYVKPYEREETVKVRSRGAIERFEKHAVGILHEFLCLTVEKMVEIERLAHFRRDFGIEVNVRELVLKHPGIFYISTVGYSQIVFLREAYCKGCLVEPNSVYVVRRKMLDLIFQGRRNTRELKTQKEMKGEKNNVACNENQGGIMDGDWIIPLLEGINNENNDDEISEIDGQWISRT